MDAVHYFLFDLQEHSVNQAIGNVYRAEQKNKTKMYIKKGKKINNKLKKKTVLLLL